MHSPWHLWRFDRLWCEFYLFSLSSYVWYMLFSHFFVFIGRASLHLYIVAHFNLIFSYSLYKWINIEQFREFQLRTWNKCSSGDYCNCLLFDIRCIKNNTSWNILFVTNKILFLGKAFHIKTEDGYFVPKRAQKQNMMTDIAFRFLKTVWKQEAGR